MEDFQKRHEVTQNVRLGTQWSKVGNQPISSFLNNGTSVFRSYDDLVLSSNNLGPPLHTGVFYCRKAKVELMPMGFREDFLYNSGLNWRMYAEGNFIPYIGQGVSSPFRGLTNDFFRTHAKGAVGWDKFRPGSGYKDDDGIYQRNPSMGQFLGELRDIPRIPLAFRNFRKRVRQIHKEAGSDFLNIQFGWIPLVRDLMSFVEGTDHMAQVLTQLIRDNGRGVRRKGKISEQESVINTITSGTGYPSGLQPAIPVQHFVGTWRKTVTERNYERYGFAARFRYYIPDLGTPKWDKAKFMRRFYGAEFPPSPEVVYELIPWSWFIDWFVDVGAVVANFSPQLAENLAADYATVTEYRLRETTTSYEFATNSGPKFCSAKLIQESKYRSNASPFGFGLTWDSFSPTQLAILAALGITRS